MEQFKSFITEEKSEDYKLLLLTKEGSSKESEYFHTAGRFLEESKKLSIPAYSLFVESGKISDGKAYNADDEEG